MGDFLGEFGGEGFEFVAGAAEGGGVVAEDAFGGLFDGASEVVEVGAGALSGFGGFGAESFAKEFGGGLKGAGIGVFGGIAKLIVEGLGEASAIGEVLLEFLDGAGFLLVQIAEGVVELLGDEGFGGFGGLG